MTAAELRSSMSDVERRLESLRQEITAGAEAPSPALLRTADDLAHSLEELHVALEEVEIANEALSAAKRVAEAERERYRTLFWLVPAVCLVTDLAGVIQEANASAEELFGRAAVYLVGKPLGVFVDPAEQWSFRQLLERLRRGASRPVEECDLALRPTPGRRVTAGVTAMPVVSSAGVTSDVRWLLRDRTVELQHEGEDQRRRERAAHRDIAGGVIHHLNNVLGSIRGYSEMLSERQSLDERSRRAARQIQTATERGERLTEQLFAFTRAGFRSPDRVTVDSVVREACEIAEKRMPPGVRIDVALAADAGASEVDGAGLQQSVLNLILNARDALAERGEIHVSTGTVELDADAAGALHLKAGPYTVVVVRDDGTGMDGATRTRAAEPFFSTKAIGQGFGLGLSMAEAVTRDAGGQLEIQSEPGAGTEVRLYLPRIQA